MDEGDRITELATLFTFLADSDFHGYSPVYERMARLMAASPERLRLVEYAAAPNARRGRVPVLFHAAVHDLTLRHPDTPLAAIFDGADVSDDELADAVDEILTTYRDELVGTMRTRSVQTNEVGRSAAIALALAALDPMERAVSLVEIGPSAGLNLFLDRWRIDYRRHDTVVASIGPAESQVRLQCELRGPLAPTRFTIPAIAGRTGVDPAPIDASDPEESRWLRACLWPGVPERPQRLAAALDVVGDDPPTLVQGDAVTDLASLIDTTDAATLPVVLATWALAYVPAEGRVTVFDALESIGATRDLAFVTLEEPRFTPWLDRPGPLVEAHHEAGDGTPTMLGLRTWHDGIARSTSLAMTHPHGQWVRWLEPGTD